MLGPLSPRFEPVCPRTPTAGAKSLGGHAGQLLTLLALSWTLAAVGEEVAYRGYVQKTLGRLFGDGAAAVLLTVIVSSALFGLAHTEQGLIGVIVFYFTGPIYGLW